MTQRFLPVLMAALLLACASSDDASEKLESDAAADASVPDVADASVPDAADVEDAPDAQAPEDVDAVTDDLLDGVPWDGDAQTSDGGALTEIVIPPSEGIDLVDNEAWALTIPAEDPWWGEDSAEELCEPTDYGPENTPIGMIFDIDTSFCGYVTLTQPLLVDAPVGSPLKVSALHYGLSDSEGPYLIALALGDPAVTVWEKVVEVPTEFEVFEGEWLAERTYTEGEPVFFHISNHGENTWTFASFELIPEAP